MVKTVISSNKKDSAMLWNCNSLSFPNKNYVGNKTILFHLKSQFLPSDTLMVLLIIIDYMI